jgi:hypothetical protein
MASSLKGNKTKLPVARLLRCRKTHRYFTGEGWSDDPAQAEVFCDQIDAVQACISHNLENIEMVLRVNGSQVELFCTTLR